MLVMNTTKCVVVGDGGVGKTSLLISFTTNQFPEEYVPTIFDNFHMDLTVSGKVHHLGLFDTAGQEEYDRLRPLAYPKTHVFLICFCTVSMPSYKNVREKWVPEIKHYCPDTPFLIVGTQVDLRGDEKLVRQKKNILSSEMGEKLAEEVGAVGYEECSAKTQKGLKDLFETAVEAAEGKCKMQKRKKSRRKKLIKKDCSLL